MKGFPHLRPTLLVPWLLVAVIVVSITYGVYFSISPTSSPRMEELLRWSLNVGMGSFLLISVVIGVTLQPRSKSFLWELSMVLLSLFPPVLWAIGLRRFSAYIMRVSVPTHVAFTILAYWMFSMLVFAIPRDPDYPVGPAILVFVIVEPLLVFIATRIYWWRRRTRTLPQVADSAPKLTPVE